MCRGFSAFLIVALFAFGASAQVQQFGPTTTGHVPVYTTGLSPVIADSGPALAGIVTEMGITNTGTPFCVNDAVTSLPYHQLCIGANALGGGLISYNAYKGATALPLLCSVNGTLSSCLNSVSGFPAVANNSALKALAVPPSSPVVYRSGFSSAGDGGGVNYTYSASSCSLNAGAGDNGSQVQSNGGGCWLAIFPPSGIDPRAFGAVANGTNVSSAMQAAATAAAGSILNIGPGLYCVGSTISIPANTQVVGQGRMGTAASATSGFQACAQNMTAILTANTQTRFAHFYIDGAHSGVNTSGTGIQTNTSAVPSNVTIDDVWINGSCVSADLSGNTITIAGSYLTGQQGSGCGGIRVGNNTTNESTVDVRIKANTVSPVIATPPDYDLLIEDCGGCSIESYNDFLFAKIGTQIFPGANQMVKGSRCTGSIVGDTNTQYGLSIDTAAVSAKVGGFYFTNCWTASAGISGVLLKNTASGTVDDLMFNAHQSINNQQNGFDIFSGVNNVKITASEFCNNSEQGTNTFPDIQLETGASAHIVGNDFSGICAAVGGSNKSNYGVNFTGSNTVTLTGNSMAGPQAAAAAGEPTGNSVVGNNLGVDNIFQSVSSASTIALNGIFPDWTVTGGTTVSTISDQWNGRTVYFQTPSGLTFSSSGGNICNTVVSPAGGMVIGIWTGGGGCWLLK